MEKGREREEGRDRENIGLLEKKEGKTYLKKLNCNKTSQKNYKSRKMIKTEKKRRRNFFVR